MNYEHAYAVSQVLEAHALCEGALPQAWPDCGQDGCTCGQLYSVVYHACGEMATVWSFAEVYAALSAMDTYL